MMTKFFITIAFVLSAFFCKSQENNKELSVIILNEEKNPIEAVTVELLRTADSALVKTAISDKAGKATFSGVKPGIYLVKASLSGYSEKYKGPIDFTQGIQNLEPLNLVRASKELQTVAVTAKKPFLQKLADRLIVNVENSIISAGSSAMDVLERSPGVSVDQNDNIGLRGKQGVIIMIDGKPTPMAGADLSNYLRGLPSSAIERIELITNPSAKYDAAGNSGIIDIRMKKDQRLGTNGTFNASYGQGVYPKANAGIMLNHRNKKLNLFGNYNYGYRLNLNHLLLERNFYTNGSFDGGDEKDNYMKAPVNFNTVRAGADYSPGSKTIIGFVVTANFNHIDRTNDNNSIVYDNLKDITHTFKTNADSRDRFNNFVSNINFKHTFDSSGKELTADADYGVYNSGSESLTGTRYFTFNGGMFRPDYLLKGLQDGKLTLKTAKADYVNPLKGNAKFEIGVKSSLVSSDNDARFFDVSSGNPVNDVEKTNHFFYDEYNNAGYINFSKEYKKFNFQFGLRGEHTKIKTLQVRNNINFDSSYFQLFPSAYFNYKLTDDNTLGISVSRRIDRPNYSQLNPFLFLIDVTTYSTGAPGLLPQITWAYELSYTLKQINFALSYSHTKNNLSTVIAPFEDVFPNIPQTENVTVQIPVNLNSSDYAGLSIAAPVKINKTWSMVNNADIYYIRYNGNLAGTPLNNGTPAARVSTNNSFQLNKGWSTELNFNYATGVRSGYMVFEPSWGLGAGFQKTVLKNKGTLRFNITDILDQSSASSYHIQQLH